MKSFFNIQAGRSVFNALRKQRGLTLVELMIAMTIGLLLLGGITSIMISSRQTYRVNEALSRMQDNARFAFQVLSRDIRMAGYFGCVGSDVTPTNTLNGPTDFLWNFKQTIYGYEATSATAWNLTPDSSITSPLGGTDIIVVRGASGDGTSAPTKVLEHPGMPGSPGSANLKVSEDNNLEEGDVVMASDCLGAAIFQITGYATAPSGFENVVHNTGSPGIVPGNLTKILGKEYTGGEILKITTRSYYIRTNDAGRPALYRKVGTADAEEVVEGIENMQILYGEDTNGDITADTYRKADAVADWGKVVSVRVNLLMQTIDDNIAGAKQPYTYNGGTVVAADVPDRRLRQVYSTVITLRNRAP